VLHDLIDPLGRCQLPSLALMPRLTAAPLRNDSFARRGASSRRCCRVIGGSFDGAFELFRESCPSSRSISSTRSRNAVISASKPSTSSTAGSPPALAIRSASATLTNARFRAPQRNPPDHPDPA
jgi:hypothetical protein